MRNIFAIYQTVNSIAILLAVAFLIIVCIIKRVGIIWYAKQLIAMWSDKDSFFGKKRVESGLAFMFALAYTCFYVYYRRHDFSIFEFSYVLTTWLLIAGYTVNMIQKEKIKDAGGQDK